MAQISNEYIEYHIIDFIRRELKNKKDLLINIGKKYKRILSDIQIDTLVGSSINIKSDEKKIKSVLKKQTTNIDIITEDDIPSEYDISHTNEILRTILVTEILSNYNALKNINEKKVFVFIIQQFIKQSIIHHTILNRTQKEADFLSDKKSQKSKTSKIIDKFSSEESEIKKNFKNLGFHKNEELDDSDIQLLDIKDIKIIKNGLTTFEDVDNENDFEGEIEDSFDEADNL
jgi:hypothetical protein